MIGNLVRVAEEGMRLADQLVDFLLDLAGSVHGELAGKEVELVINRVDALLDLVGLVGQLAELLKRGAAGVCVQGGR